MQKIVAACTAIIALTLTSWGDAGAQYYPPGSYQASCRHMVMNGSVLTASCTGPQGHYFRSSIDASRCASGNVRNLNGFLACGVPTGPPGPGYGPPHLPHGSWRMSCSNAVVHAGQLTATCPSANGTRIRSSIYIRPCRGGDIQNRNGYLACVF
jgi:hypothetical protein